MPLDNDYDLANDTRAERPVTEQPRPRAHLADIVAALWASGYRPVGNTTPADLDRSVGRKSVYTWHDATSGKRWVLYTTDATTSRERIISAGLTDLFGRELFDIGDAGPDTHYRVLDQITDRRTARPDVDEAYDRADREGITYGSDWLATLNRTAQHSPER